MIRKKNMKKPSEQRGTVIFHNLLPLFYQKCPKRNTQKKAKMRMILICWVHIGKIGHVKMPKNAQNVIQNGIGEDEEIQRDYLKFLSGNGEIIHIKENK